MKASEARQAFILRNITAVLMTFAVTAALNTYFHLEISLLFLLVGALACDVVAMFIDRLKGKWVFWLGLAVLLAAGWMVLEILDVPVRDLIRQAQDWVRGAWDWFLSYTQNPELLRHDAALAQELLAHPAYTLFFAVAALVIAMLVLYPMSYRMVTRLLLSVLTLGALIALPVLDIALGKLPLACAGICVISSVIELVNLQFDRHRMTSKRSAGLFLYPISVLLILVAILLPARDTPIRWQPVRDFFNRMSVTFESVEVTLKIWTGAIPERFSVTFNGMSFTEDEGSVDVDESAKLMEVTTNGMTRSSTYLRGNVSSTYTGTGWEDETEDYFGEEEAMMELYEIMYSMHRSGLKPEKGEDLHKRTTLFVTFDDIITKSVMFAAPLSHIETDRDVKFDFYGPNVRFDRMQKIETEYTMSFYETNWGSPTLQEYLRSLHGFRYVDDPTVVSELERKNGSAYNTLYVAVNIPSDELYNDAFPSLLADRARTIREVYMQLPDTVPERVYDLAQEITADAETTYDKILAIEEYFKERYTYTRTPELFPEDRDVVDWFLFDTTEGYCTYYATAAAVLARCAGLPSRYVEGVMVQDTLRSRDVANVTNQSVHAWTEIYLEGYGWIPIEPTPGYGVSRNQEWARRQPGGGSLNTAPEVPPVMEMPPQEVVTPEEEEGLSAAELALLEAQRREQLRRFWTWASCIAGGVIVMVAVLALLLSKQAKARRYNRASDNDKIRILMREIIRCVSITGVHLRDHETLMEYVERAGLGFDYSDMKLSEAAMLFMRVRYAGIQATRMEVLGMYRYTRELRRETLKQQNLFKRIYFSIVQFVQ